MGQPGVTQTVVRMWPADSPATRHAAELAAERGQLVAAQWVVRRGRPALRVVLRGDQRPARWRPDWRVIGLTAAGVASIGACWVGWWVLEWLAAHLVEVVAWATTAGIAAWVVRALVRKLLGR